MADTPIFHRLFKDPSSPDVVSFNLTFTGNSGTSSNFTDALRNSQLKIYIFPVGSNTNAALNIDPNTGTNYTYLPTYLDPNPGSSPYPNIQGSYALALHGGNQGGKQGGRTRGKGNTHAHRRSAVRTGTPVSKR